MGENSYSSTYGCHNRRRISAHFVASPAFVNNPDTEVRHLNSAELGTGRDFYAVVSRNALVRDAEHDLQALLFSTFLSLTFGQFWNI